MTVAGPPLYSQNMTLPKLLLFLTLPLYVLDQITKFWTIATFPPPWEAPGANIAVMENFFHLVRVHNQGVAFGFGNGTSGPRWCSSSCRSSPSR